MSRVEKLLYRVREASGTLMCAEGDNCSSPQDCVRWAAEDIAAANQVIAEGPVRVRAVGHPGGGPTNAQVTRVTDDACLVVELDSGSQVTVFASEVSA